MREKVLVLGGDLAGPTAAPGVAAPWTTAVPTGIANTGFLPGPRAHAGTLMFEKYLLRKARHGYAQLP